MFLFKEHYSAKFQANAFNAFNVVNYYGLNATDTDFGTLPSAYPPRNLQLGLKSLF